MFNVERFLFLFQLSTKFDGTLTGQRIFGVKSNFIFGCKISDFNNATIKFEILKYEICYLR